jgi:hypothetical protein
MEKKDLSSTGNRSRAIQPVVIPTELSRLIVREGGNLRLATPPGRCRSFLWFIYRRYQQLDDLAMSGRMTDELVRIWKGVAMA